MHSILIVDDHESIHEMLDAVVEPLGFSPKFANSAEKALALFKQGGIRIVLTDIKMAPLDGIGLLRELKAIDPNVIVILMSGFATIDTAKQAMRLGAFDYLTKPFKVDQLIAALNRAQAKQRNRGPEGNGDAPASSLVGNSPAIQGLRSAISALAESASIALIQGETGTQKNLVAEIIHQTWSDEPETSPLVPVDCAGIGDAAQLAPFLEKAKGGTLHLASIDQLPRPIQGAVGAQIGEAKSSSRIICSAGRNLETLVEKGEFDESLYFRISPAVIQIPGLRERADDIPDIVKSILAEIGRDAVELSDRASALLRAYRWPGNHTELHHAVEHAASRCSDNAIRPEDLPAKVTDTSQWPSLADYVAAQSKEYMRLVLGACQGDAAKAAAILKCPPADLAKLKG